VAFVARLHVRPVKLAIFWLVPPHVYLAILSANVPSAAKVQTFVPLVMKTIFWRVQLRAYHVLQLAIASRVAKAQTLALGVLQIMC
jgi:hypothetical protein